MKRQDWDKYFEKSSPFSSGVKLFMFLVIWGLWIIAVIYDSIPLALIGGFLCLDWVLTEQKYNLYSLRVFD